jgi:alkanesulfonate monooxygenase SsuD/methylene tetrahydromethanopterin reductase-like flavin-dependent oxidoreductase (luciferase family)
MSRSPESRHQKLQASQNTYLDPEEARFITADMIKALCVIGQPEEVVEQLRDLEHRGVNEVVLTFPPGPSYRALEDFSRKVIEKY